MASKGYYGRERSSWSLTLYIAHGFKYTSLSSPDARTNTVSLPQAVSKSARKISVQFGSQLLRDGEARR